MTDRIEKYRHDTALFRYGVINRVLKPPPGESRTLAQRIRQVASESHDIPGSTRTRVAPQTLRSWLSLYDQGGFDALIPKTRRDAGRPRRLSVPLIEALVEQKQRHPKISVKDAIANVRQVLALDSAVPIPPSTVNRLFHREGLMHPTRESIQDCRRFSHEYANELWMADVMHGPSVAAPGQRRRKAYLIAIIDDASRLIPYAAFALSENAAAFTGVLKQALLRRSLPAKLYVDNGSTFCSHQLSLACARLNIALIHSRPYKPQGRGKIERWFKTCRGQFIAHLTDADTACVEALNRALHAWVEGEYHRTPHRGIDNLTPLDKWASCALKVQPLPEQIDLDDLFLFEVRRKVLKDRTVRLHNRIYETQPELIGRTVTVRFDPQAPPNRPIKIVCDGHPSTARLVDLHVNATVKRNTPPIDFTRFPNSEQ